MKKRIIFILLALIITVMPMTAIATNNVEVSEEIIIKPSGKYVKLDGKDIIINAYLLKGANYVKLEDIAGLMKDTKAEFSIEKTAATTELIPGGKYEGAYTAPTEALAEDKGAKPSEHKVTVDGKVLDTIGLTIDGADYFKIRDIGKAVGFGVAYDWTKNTILLDSENVNIEDYKVVEEFDAVVNEIETNAGVQKVSFIIYGFEECPHCKNLKAYLDGKGIKYVMHDIRLNDAKKGAIYDEFYTTFDKEYDRVYYPTHVMTLEDGDKSISKAVVGFQQDNYDSIFEEIKNNTYFK